MGGMDFLLSSKFSDVNKRILDIILNVQNTMELTDEELFAGLNLTKASYQKVLAGEKHIGLESFLDFLEKFKISIDSTVAGGIDYVALREHFRGNKGFVPERYTFSPESKLRAPAYMLDYVERTEGNYYKMLLMRKLQITSDLFQNLEQKVSATLSSDLCQSILRLTHDEKKVVDMGRNFYNFSKESPIGNQFRQSRSISEAYEMMCYDIIPKNVENNCDYRLGVLKKNYCEIWAYPNSKVLHTLGTDTLTNKAFSLLREGFASIPPMYFGLPPSKVVTTACVSLGFDYCRMEISFPQAVGHQ